MIAPTTREELVEWLAGEIDGYSNAHTRDYLNRLLDKLNTIAVVCPREPTDEMCEACFDDGPEEDTQYAMIGRAFAASPFAKEPTDG